MTVFTLIYISNFVIKRYINFLILLQGGGGGGGRGKKRKRTRNSRSRRKRSKRRERSSEKSNTMKNENNLWTLPLLQLKHFFLWQADSHCIFSYRLGLFMAIFIRVMSHSFFPHKFRLLCLVSGCFFISLFFWVPAHDQKNGTPKA